jgi:ABC-type branched-subunit amino acid transport system permease subunit
MGQGGAFVQVMSLQWSSVVVLMVLIGGGLVSFWGPVIGTVIYFIATCSGPISPSFAPRRILSTNFGV